MLATLFVLCASAVFINTTFALTPEGKPKTTRNEVTLTVGEPPANRFEAFVFEQIREAWMERAEHWIVYACKVECERISW